MTAQLLLYVLALVLLGLAAFRIPEKVVAYGWAGLLVAGFATWILPHLH